MSHPSSVTVRVAQLPGEDAAVVGTLVGAYLLQTEREKAERGMSDAGAELAPEYREEVSKPAQSFAGATVYVAELEGAPVGLAVVRALADYQELKRVWVEPDARGRGVGSALVAAALSRASSPTRLSVWDSRTAAIGLYSRHGFAAQPTWESRERLVCMEAPATADP